MILFPFRLVCVKCHYLYLCVQIEDVRLRLNVDVTVASDSSPALAPIESFTDMVIFIDLYLVPTGLVCCLPRTSLRKFLCISIFSVFASEHHEGYSDSWIHYAYSYSGAGNASCPQWKGYAGLCWNGKWQNGCIQHSDDTGLMWWNLIFPSFIMWSLIEYVAQFYLFFKCSIVWRNLLFVVVMDLWHWYWLLLESLPSK